jgi:uncharacterized membrane protein
MIQRMLALVTFGAALGSGVIGGVFFAFSSFVLPALARLRGLDGMAAMQSINVVVLNRSFLGVFAGTALACAVVVGDGCWHWAAPGAGLRVSGGLFYLIGTFAVTMELNVPWNDRLAALPAHGAEAARAWAEFVASWGLWNHVRGAAAVVAAALLMLAMTGCSRYWECAPPDTARSAKLPERLSQTGLYGVGDPARIAVDVLAFAPEFELWSDGASKRRWLSLPVGERIDTSDIDNWVFPVGTQLWKEFRVNGVRVETRLLRKVGFGAEDWATQAYVWRPDGSDAVATPGGATNALGTAHDVPAAGECMACHGGRKSFVLGFSAVQLAYDAGPDRIDLNDLVERGLVTAAPSTSLTVPGRDVDRQALGYLHANCGHCHNQDRPAAARSRCYNPSNELDFWLRAAGLDSVQATPTYRSGRGTAFEPGRPDDSRMLELMSNRGFLRQMPPLGTERTDPRGLSAVRTWIARQN